MPSRTVNMADSCASSTVIPGYLKGWKIFNRKVTAVAIGPKILSRTRFQGSYEQQQQQQQLY